MAVFITGDVHSGLDARKLMPAAFDASGLGRGDYVIVLGDFGLPWRNPEDEQDTRWLDWFEARPWTTLFLDGNHENFDVLDALPAEEWAGGHVHRIREHVMHLCRAEVFDIGGHTFFTMGGAYSIDKAFRTPFESWWPQEVPDEHVRAKADEVVAQIREVDYVLTHCPPKEEFVELCLANGFSPHPDEWMVWLQEHVADRLGFRKWFYGHMHADRPWSARFVALFDAIYDLGGTGRTPYGPHTNWAEVDLPIWPDDVL